ncbi:hypothetical protein CONLIGDRAFT_686053 [Coniochaeta ligniaria NRRL 30616]|uniref:Uncharacterized protein n=1 Tax=Coniochaeta ligniaria NRRL 30616 TaxID=1408157 RepID=A0A1J7I859_9PEZI|nr:hypothetical protein CONLIGDRAFT_686053 [Coniochaeta ligniaria NRRL 30616]
MDLDPDLAWPFWKFGLKKDDLFTKLHDQYNTFPSSIQDPEAFHHDVYECSQQAGTTEEFHRLLTTRKEQRLRELNTSLESASLEIIANPSLIGTERWQFALQLFRTKSLDSLVRYFSSYLPDDHPWHEAGSETCPSSRCHNDVKSKIHSSTSDEPTFFDDSDESGMLTHEPFSMLNSLQSHLPPSPRSMTMCSDESRDGPHHNYLLHNLTPARTLSFSESESERFTLASGLEDSEHLRHDESSQPESPISEYSEIFSETPAFEMLEKEDAADITHRDDPAATAVSRPSVETEFETPTPKPQPHAAPFFDTRPSPVQRRGCSFSPSRPHPLAQVHSLPNDEHTKPAVSTRLRRRDHSPGRGRRRSPGEPSTRIQKSLPGHVGSRHRGRRRVQEC